jgi:hypothetical protein
MIYLERLGYLVLDLCTIGLAYLALLCWGAVLDGTAAANSDGGIAVFFTVMTVFMGTMRWIGRGR